MAAKIMVRCNLLRKLISAEFEPSLSQKAATLHKWRELMTEKKLTTPKIEKAIMHSVTQQGTRGRCENVSVTMKVAIKK